MSPDGSRGAGMVVMSSPRMSARVGDQTDALDSGEGAGFVVLRAIPADSDGAEQVALLVADQGATTGRRDAAFGDGGQGGEERGVAGGVPGADGAPLTRAETTPGLRLGDLR